MKKSKIDYKGIALLKMSRDAYKLADDWFEALCEHLDVPEGYEANMWDYIIDDEKTTIPQLKKTIQDWRKEEAKNKKRKGDKNS